MAKALVVKIENHIPEAIRKIEKAGYERMVKATKYVRGKVLVTLSGNRHGRTYKVPGTKNTYYTASSPGEAPASATGDLRGDITDEVRVNKRTIVGYVGNTKRQEKKAFSLEFGRRGMAPRPYLNKTFDMAKNTIKNILSGKWL